MADADRPITDLTPRRHRRAVKRLVNAERRGHGLRAVRHAPSLSLSARRWARWMIRNSKFTHGNQQQRLQRSPYARLARRRGQRFRIGEALAQGARENSTPRSLVDAWMASPQHRAVLLGQWIHGACWSLNDLPTPGRQPDGVTVVLHVGRRGR